jgi:hypothetical protein
MSAKCEHEKEAALYHLKNRQLHTELEELRKKEALSSLNLKNIEVSSANKMKALKEEYEERTKEKEAELRKLKVRSIDL